jgi:hypothetical protein
MPLTPTPALPVAASWPCILVSTNCMGVWPRHGLNVSEQNRTALPARHWHLHCAEKE